MFGSFSAASMQMYPIPWKYFNGKSMYAMLKKKQNKSVAPTIRIQFVSKKSPLCRDALILLLLLRFDYKICSLTGAAVQISKIKNHFNLPYLHSTHSPIYTLFYSSSAVCLCASLWYGKIHTMGCMPRHGKWRNLLV